MYLFLMSLKRVSVQDLMPGKRLGENVFSGKGILLAKKDQLVDHRLIQILKSFGLVDAVIHSEETQGGEGNLSRQNPEIVKRLLERFKNLDLRKPMIQKLFDLTLVRSLKLSGEPSKGETGK